MTTALEQKPLLLVEDNPMDVELTLRAFKKHNLRNPVVVARDGEEAMAHVDGWIAGAPKPVVILLDLKLPRVDGLDVLAKIKSTPEIREIPVVVLTSSKDSRDIQTAYQIGANSYIVKPVDFEKFLDVANQVQSYWCVINENCP